LGVGNIHGDESRGFFSAIQSAAPGRHYGRLPRVLHPLRADTPGGPSESSGKILFDPDFDGDFDLDFVDGKEGKKSCPQAS
jgi:hypothetical protein